MEEEKKVSKKRTYKKKTTKKKDTLKEEKTVKKVKEEDIPKEEVVLEEKHEEKSVTEKSDDKFTAIEVIIVMVLSLVLGLVLGAFITNTRGGKRNYDDDVSRIDEYVDKYYYGTYDKERFNEESVKGIIDTLDDPYAYFIPKEEAAAYIESTMGEFVGIGLQIYQNEEGYPQIMKVFEGGPSEKAGLKENDVIIKVEGENIQNQDINEVVSKIKNQKPGEKVTITVRRDGEEIDFSMKRERVIEPSITVSYSDKTAIITISNFTNNTYGEFEKAYEKVKSEQVTGLILDLRGNVGTDLESATKIAEMFLDKGDVIYQLEDNTGKDLIKDKKNKEIKLNTVVLVNAYTSGISELFVCALKDNLGLTVIGTKTNGNNKIQSVYGLENGSYVRFTTGEWYTPKGKSIDGEGIKVDIEASGTEDYNETSDLAFAKALEALKDNSI